MLLLFLLCCSVVVEVVVVEVVVVEVVVVEVVK